MKSIKQTLFRTLIFLWNLNPFKKWGASLVKRNPVFLEKMYKDLRYEGVFNVSVDHGSFMIYNPGYTTIENELFWKGLQGWEKISMGLWKELAKKSKVIIDIGANTGLYSLIASSVNSNAKIHSFEPVQRTAELLKINLRLNSPNKIEFHQVAVSDFSGIATFYDLDTKSQYSASLNKEMLSRFDNRLEYEVEVVRLDEFSALDNLKVGLIKLDVEMHEPEAIEGMIGILKRDRPTLLVEILSDELGERIESQIGDMGYRYFNIDEKNPPIEVYSLTASKHYNYLLIQDDKLKELGSLVYNNNLFDGKQIINSNG